MIKKIFSLAVVLYLFVQPVFSQNYLSPDLQKLDMVVMAVKQFYVTPTEESKLVDDAINGMLTKLDPHSVYIPKKEVAEMNEPLDGNFEGIGVTYQMMRDTLLVISTISGAPAEKVGVVAGDRIIAANDTSIAGVHMSTRDIQQRLRGNKGTVVTVKVLRRGVRDTLVFNIVRDKIPLYSIDASYMVNSKVGYIKVNRFSATTYEEFYEAFKKLKASGMESLIVDLQGNGGGYLSQATQLVDEFLSKNKLAVYTQGQNQPRWEYKVQGDGHFQNGKLIVLVDESSASASEIFTGAMQDWDRALVVGRRTFGKGLVQRPFPLPDGSQMRLTVARYYTPTGRCIQRSYEGGIEQYRHDFIDRYNRGELTDEDKIVFPDSLRYKTLKLGRVVYGGGGIMPDVFVPLDTTEFTVYHRNLIAKGVVNKFVLQYNDLHRKQLESTYKNADNGFSQYLTQFSIAPVDMDSLVAMGSRDGVKFDSAQYAKSKDLIAYQIKAIIARDLWSMSEYFQMMNLKDRSFLKAVEILSDKDSYSNYLHKTRK